MAKKDHTTAIVVGTGLGLLALFVGTTIVRKGVGAKKLEFYPRSIGLKKLSPTNLVGDLLTTIVNPSYAEQSVDAIFLNVYMNGTTQIGRVQITVPFKIAPLNTTEITLPIQIFPAGAGYVLAEIIKGNKPLFSVKGTIASMGVTIIVNYDFA